MAEWAAPALTGRLSSPTASRRSIQAAQQMVPGCWHAHSHSIAGLHCCWATVTAAELPGSTQLSVRQFGVPPGCRRLVRCGHNGAPKQNLCALALLAARDEHR